MSLGIGIIASQRNKFLLDQYAGAAAAYSLRKLRSGYTGSAIRVRRSSDNTEQDIGFTSAGNLDESALTTFVGANNGFVVTWYDQSGNSLNATQSTAANQPSIITSGSTITQNNRTSLIFDGSNDYLLTNNYNFISTGNIYIGIVATSETNNATRVPFGLNDNSTYRSFASYFQSTGRFAAQYSLNNTILGVKSFDFSYSINTLYFYETLYDTNNITQANRIIGYQNNTIMGQNTNNGLQGNMQANNKPLSIGADGLGNFRHQGKMQEIIFYTGNKSGIRNRVAENINSYYQIY
jgi:hypothetical protein